MFFVPASYQLPGNRKLLSWENWAGASDGWVIWIEDPQACSANWKAIRNHREAVQLELELWICLQFRSRRTSWSWSCCCRLQRQRQRRRRLRQQRRRCRCRRCRSLLAQSKVTFWLYVDRISCSLSVGDVSSQLQNTRFKRNRITIFEKLQSVRNFVLVSRKTKCLQFSFFIVIPLPF